MRRLTTTFIFAQNSSFSWRLSTSRRQTLRKRRKTMENDSRIFRLMFALRSDDGARENVSISAAEAGLGSPLDYEISNRRFQCRARWIRGRAMSRTTARRAEMRGVAYRSRGRRRDCSRIHPQAPWHPSSPAHALDPPRDDFEFRRNRASSMALFDETSPTALRTQARTPRHSDTRGIEFPCRPARFLVADEWISAQMASLGPPLGCEILDRRFRRRARRI